jgi:hypothetical protein
MVHSWEEEIALNTPADTFTKFAKQKVVDVVRRNILSVNGKEKVDVFFRCCGMTEVDRIYKC